MAVAVVAALAGAVVAAVPAFLGGRSSAPTETVVDTQTVTETVTVTVPRVTPPHPPPPGAPCTTRSEGSRASRYEPNNQRVNAYGPLLGDRTYMRGVIENTADVDWYVFCVTEEISFTATVTTVGDGCLGPQAALYAEGETEMELRDSDYGFADDGSTADLADTTTGPARYFLQVEAGNFECRDHNYEIDLDPEEAFGKTLPEE
jgi:hypothetical protein